MSQELSNLNDSQESRQQDLPANNGVVHSTDAKSGNGDTPSSSHSRILCIDEHPDATVILHEALDEPGIQLQICNSPRNALTIANRYCPSLIILDIAIKEMEGFEMLRELRLNPTTSNVPILILTELNDPQAKNRAFEAGADDYLIKMPDRVELLARIRYHGKARLAREQQNEAFETLCLNQQQLIEKNRELILANTELDKTIRQIRELKGLVSICCHCKRIRDDQNIWHLVETYFSERADIHFSHGLCPECFARERSEVNEYPAPPPPGMLDLEEEQNNVGNRL